MKKCFITLVSALWALTLFGQFWSRTYFNNSIGGSTFIQLNQSNTGSVIGSANLICSNDMSCISHLNISFHGDSSYLTERLGFLGFRESTILRNDTIFISDNSFSADSFFCWHFGMYKISGEKIVEHTFKLLHLSNAPLGSFGYVGLKNYGLTLVKNNEVILWGEGIDNRMPNPNNVPYRSVFLRVGLDGIPKSDLLWYEYNEHKERRMSDATVDIDGNLVFAYEARSQINGVTFRFIIKLSEENNFTIIEGIESDNAYADFPKIAVDLNGNYIFQIKVNEILWEYNTHSEVPYITKMDRQGTILWSKLIPPVHKKPFDQIFSSAFRLNRISTTSNNDILCAGTCLLSDSFYIKPTGMITRLDKWVSFIARFDTDGNLKWRHFLAPQKQNGELYRNIVFDIQEGHDGSIIVGGQLERDDDIPGFNGDAWLMRLSADGCLNNACDHLEKYWHFPSSIVATSNLDINKLSFYPNPGRDFIQVSKDEQMQFPVRYEVLDIQGQRLEIGTFIDQDNFQIEAGWLSKGMYLILIMDKTGKVWQGKWKKG